MRIIPLEDTKNAYTRIRGMHAYEGLNLDPEKTAPFKVRWNPNRQGPEIVIRDTIMAVVELGDRGPRLHINEMYPEDMDFALLRALRNAVSFAEQVSRVSLPIDESRGIFVPFSPRARPGRGEGVFSQ